MIQRALQLLHASEVIGLPTETVYGLGGDATNSEAVAKIYTLKGRPSFNPLIIHIASLEAAKKHAIFNSMALKLAAKFWPGPLTLVLPLQANHQLSPLVTAGLDTVAIRCPNHPIAQKLLSLYPNPIAAPSANKSGYISPTQAAHVHNCFGDKVFVLDGGSSPIGLESTIIDCSTDVISILRPGFITPIDIEAVTDNMVSYQDPHQGIIKSPGQLKTHYAPTIPLRMNATEILPNEGLLSFGNCNLIAEFELNLSLLGNVVEAATNLFDFMHKMDKLGQDGKITSIAVTHIPNDGIGIAINDRLSRAAAKK